MSMGLVVVDGKRRYYDYRISVKDSAAGAGASASANLEVGFHDIRMETVVVQRAENHTAIRPRIKFRLRGRLTRTTRNRLDHLLYTGDMTRPMRKHAIALLCSLYPNGIMVDAHVSVESFDKESREYEGGEDIEEDPLFFYRGYRYPEPEPEREEGEEEEDPRHLVGFEFQRVSREVPASRAAVEALLETTRVDGDDELQCPICLDPLHTPGSALAKMPCSHSFHRDCILTWLHNKPVCPLCRFTLPAYSAYQPYLASTSAPYI